MLDRPDISIETDAGFVIDAPHAGAPLILSFGFAAWNDLPRFDFVGRLRKLEKTSGQPLNMVHIRDTSNFWYQHGVQGLGEDVRETADSLRDIIARMKPPGVATVGQSMGGYAAIMFGALLGVERVLAFGPLSHLRSDWAKRDGDLRWLSVMETLDRFPPPHHHDDLGHDDLVALLRACPRPPRVRVVYGTGDQDPSPNLDALHALRLAELPMVEAVGIADAPHAVVQWLVDHGRIDATLRAGLLPAEDAPRPAPARTDEAGGPSTPVRAAPRPSFNAAWRGWIAENIVLGVEPARLLETLAGNGFPPREAQREIDLARHSPYLRPSAQLVQRLRKRDWLLEVRRQLYQLTHGPMAPVDRRHRLSGEELLRDYYSRQQPVVITGMMDGWPAMGWTLPDLAARFAGRTVQVQTDRERNADYEIQAPSHRSTLLFEDFVAAVQQRPEHNDVYMTAGNAAYNRQIVPELWDDLRPLDAYLTCAPGAMEAMIWIGPAGTVTPTHHDLTNNLIAQVCGAKRIWLADAAATAHIYNDRHVFSPVDLETIDLARFPLMRDVPVWQVDLHPGELLFVPIGWWHQVRALDISVTLTYTNFRFDNNYYAAYPR